MFIWDGPDVLTDAGSGLIVAIAEDLEGALLAVEKKCSYGMNCFPTHKPNRVIDLSAPDNEADAWVCWGSG